MEVKLSLQSDVFQVIADFAENYSFILQDEAQGFNNSQATIHPLLYIMQNHHLSYVHHLSFAVISHCLHHDTVPVYVFKKCLIKFLKNKIQSSSS